MVSDVMKFINVNEIFCKDCNLKDTDDCNYCDVRSMPAADVVPVVHGHWINPTVIDGRAFNIPHCSICNEVPCGVDEHTNYCPNCGAKMEGV